MSVALLPFWCRSTPSNFSLGRIALVGDILKAYPDFNTSIQDLASPHPTPPTPHPQHSLWHSWQHDIIMVQMGKMQP